METISFIAIEERGEDILNPKSYFYKAYSSGLNKKDLTLDDFPPHWVAEYENHLLHTKLVQALRDPSVKIYVKLNHGARAGSIALLTNRHQVLMDNYGGFDYKGYAELLWDSGKKWKFKTCRSVNNLKGGELYHDFLIGYEGPTVEKFTKSTKEAQPLPVLIDCNGRRLEIGDWVMESQFKLGKITRISQAGTFWIQFTKTKSGPPVYLNTPVQYGRNPSEVMKIDPPEGFDAIAMFMDNDLSTIDIIPSFQYHTV